MIWDEIKKIVGAMVLLIIAAIAVFMNIQQNPPQPNWTTNAGESVTLTSPADNTFSDDVWNVYFQFYANGTTLKNCSLWTNYTGAWNITQWNQTSLSNTTNSSINYTFSTVKSIIWNIVCYNTSSASFIGSSNRTLKLSNNTITVLEPPGWPALGSNCDMRNGTDKNKLKYLGGLNITANSTYNLTILVRLDPMFSVGRATYFVNTSDNATLRQFNYGTTNATIFSSLNNTNSSLAYFWKNCTNEFGTRYPNLLFIARSQ